jgi:hypothetical protein
MIIKISSDIGVLQEDGKPGLNNKSLLPSNPMQVDSADGQTTGTSSSSSLYAKSCFGAYQTDVPFAINSLFFSKTSTYRVNTLWMAVLAFNYFNPFSCQNSTALLVSPIISPSRLP